MGLLVDYNIDIGFETHVERTSRVLDVAEAFGLGLDDKRFVVFDNLTVRVDQGDIVYITGQSGSGKSLLLKDLMLQMRKSGLKVANIDEIEFDDRPLIEQVGDTMNESINLLSKAGVNDAYLLIRKPQELSDGQRYRLRLAKLIASDADIWVADEFGAVLDRVTAKVVAFNMQKVARKLGKTLMVATTHVDLGDELGPDTTVTKRFQSRVEIERKAKELVDDL